MRVSLKGIGSRPRPKHGDVQQRSNTMTFNTR
jgi:hypothetical protein